MEVVAGRDVGYRPKGVLSALPDKFPFGIVGSHPDRTDPVVGTYPLDDLDFSGNTGGEAVKFHDENSSGVQRVAGTDELLDSLDHLLVHDLEGRRNYASGNNAGDHFGGINYRLEVQQQGHHDRRIGGQPDSDPGCYSERTLAAHEGSAQVVADRIAYLFTQDHGAGV